MVTETGQIESQELDKILAETGRAQSALIPILQAIQRRYHYLPEEALRYVCQHSEITPAAVVGVASFYPQFRHKPAGKHTVSVCVGTACHVKGAPQVYDALRRHLDIAADTDTDAEGLFTVCEVSCLGCCTLAPAVQIDQVIYGYVGRDNVGDILQDFLQRGASDDSSGTGKEAGAAAQSLGEIRVGLGSCCLAAGAADIEKRLRDYIAVNGTPVRLKRVSCVGMCYREPLVEVVPTSGEPTLYTEVQADDVPDIVNHHFPAPTRFRRARSRLQQWLEQLYTDQAWRSLHRFSMHQRDPQISSFLDPQKHLATENYGHIDPTDLAEYEKCGGFAAFARCLQELAPEQVIAQISASGLRGRGGGGYATGIKWGRVAHEQNDVKYVICNGDEGDPGAFMDRMLLESYPYRVIEGVMIGAYAVGARHAILYIRAEYPLALKRAQVALTRCREHGLLGKNIQGSDFALDIEIMEGAGAFVCGEETALIASLEGRRGMPRLRPPYPAQKGFRNCPTLVNNTETFALVPWIMRNGAAAFAGIGTEKSKGTKVFALAGKIKRGGLIEVSMGITIRQIIDEIGGGIADGHKLKAVQIGGPSGGCIPARLDQTPIDFEALTEVGAMMGSGGLVVMDDRDCMVEIARYFLSFTQQESCGKCTFCRIGTKRMLEILQRICAGDGKAGDLDELEHLAKVVTRGSLCGLGRTAPNPVLTALRYFRDEYEAHLRGECPARQCKALIQYRIADTCIGCTICAQHCPTDAIQARPYEQHEIELEKCIQCDSCRQVCPVEAVKVENRSINVQ